MILSLFLFLGGLIFGSFLNSLIYRIDSKEGFKGRSFCPKCKKTIKWYDNIPLVSFAFLGGRCRQCKKQISIQYPTVELLTALLFLLSGILSDPGKVIYDWLNIIFNGNSSESIQFPIIAIISLILLLATCFLLLTIAIYDAKTKYVLTYYAYSAATIAFLFNLTEYFKDGGEWTLVNIFSYLVPFFLAAFIPAGLFWLISSFSKEKFMGSGDADIALAIGLLVGWPLILTSYYFAFITGSIWGVFLLLTKRGTMKSEVPFGPFLIAGAFFGIFFGQQIIDLYARIYLGL